MSISPAFRNNIFNNLTTQMGKKMLNLTEYEKHEYQSVEYFTLKRKYDTLIIGEITPDRKHFAFITTAKDGKTINDAIQEELDFRSFKKEARANRDRLLLKFEQIKFYTYKGVASSTENPHLLHLLALEGEIEGEWKTILKLKEDETLSELEKRQFRWLSSEKLI